jgi:hypothetical protein
MTLSQMSLPAISGPRLIVIAAVLHVSFALALFVAGRAGVAPGLIDRDGIMGSFAFDSYQYQGGAIETSELLRSGNLRAWASAAQPLHVKVIAIPFALLSPVFGYSILSGEPYNLLFYLAIVSLVFALGTELGGRRAGIFAAVLVALWPTFLLHTLQLLKDSIFITAALAFVWCAITLLSRTYQPAASAGVSLLAILLLLLLAFVRGSSVVLLVAVAILILGLLIVRQATERRVLFWNMLPAIAILLIGLILAPFISGRIIHCLKKYPTDQAGPSKSVADPSKQVPTVIAWNVREPSKEVPTAGDRLARRISSMRSRFAASYSEAGSLLDPQEQFSSVSDLLLYIPRAFAVGMWAPFPSSWFFSGKRVGNVGKIISGLETLAIYLLQALAAVALIRQPRQLARWFLIAVIVAGVTAVAVVVPNVGAIYRFRYVFWILLILIATSGFSAKQHNWEGLKRVMLTAVIAGMLAVVHGCASYAAAVAPVNAQTARLGVTNFTGTAFSAVYLSPSSAPDWQENLLINSIHRDGDTLDIQFDLKESNVEWDLKVQGVDGHYAEWKNLKFDRTSDITLVLKLSPTPVVVAEVE